MKKYSLFIIFILSLILYLVIDIRFNIYNIKRQYITEVNDYLEKKYSCKMSIKNEVIVGDEKSVQAYPVENPEIVFFVRKGNMISDTFLSECLRNEVYNILKTAFSYCHAEIYVSELKWCNPTPDGKNETFLYLDSLYYESGRIPTWKDVNNYQKIECAKVILSVKIEEDNIIYETVQKVQNSGCHIERLQITDSIGKVYEYSF